MCEVSVSCDTIASRTLPGALVTLRCLVRSAEYAGVFSATELDPSERQGDYGPRQLRGRRSTTSNADDPEAIALAVVCKLLSQLLSLANPPPPGHSA